MPEFPALLRTTVKFAAEGEHATRVTVVSETASADPGEIAAFRNERPGMTLGWTASFDKLDAMISP